MAARQGNIKIPPPPPREFSFFSTYTRTHTRTLTTFTSGSAYLRISSSPLKDALFAEIIAITRGGGGAAPTQPRKIYPVRVNRKVEKEYTG